MSLNRFTPAESRAVHLLKAGDVFIEYGGPYQKWTVTADAVVVKGANGMEYVEVRIKEHTQVIRYPHYQRTRVKLYHDSQFRSYNYG